LWKSKKTKDKMFQIIKKQRLHNKKIGIIKNSIINKEPAINDELNKQKDWVKWELNIASKDRKNFNERVSWGGIKTIFI